MNLLANYPLSLLLRVIRTKFHRPREFIGNARRYVELLKPSRVLGALNLQSKRPFSRRLRAFLAMINAISAH